jgi:hypothetical protein
MTRSRLRFLWAAFYALALASLAMLFVLTPPSVGLALVFWGAAAVVATGLPDGDHWGA